MLFNLSSSRSKSYPNVLRAFTELKLYETNPETDIFLLMSFDYLVLAEAGLLVR